MSIEQRIEVLKKSPMSVGFREFWLGWRLVTVSTFLSAPILGNDVLLKLLLGIYGTFLIAEGWGIFRQGRGDTLSESRWTTGMKGLAYRIWSIGFAVMYVLGFAMLMVLYKVYTEATVAPMGFDGKCPRGGSFLAHSSLLLSRKARLVCYSFATTLETWVHQDR